MFQCFIIIITYYTTQSQSVVVFEMLKTFNALIVTKYKRRRFGLKMQIFPPFLTLSWLPWWGLPTLSASDMKYNAS